MDIVDDTADKGKVVAESGVGVLDKSVEILALLAEEGPTGLAGVVEATGIPRPTAHRLLAALEVHHLVARGNGRYKLGLRLLGWGEKAAEGTDLVEVARPVLEGLRDESGESVQLYVREGDRRVCVISVERVGGGLRDMVPVGSVLTVGSGFRRYGVAGVVGEQGPGEVRGGPPTGLGGEYRRAGGRCGER